MNTYQIKEFPACIHECYTCTRLDAQECKHYPLQYMGKALYGVLFKTAPLPDENENKPLNEYESGVVEEAYYDIATKNVPYWENEIEELKERLAEARTNLSVAIQTRDKIKDIYIEQKRHPSEMEVDEQFHDTMQRIYWKYYHNLGDDSFPKGTQSIMEEVRYKLKLKKRRKVLDNRVSK